jgi:CheY-like chemotaxis protein
MQASATATGSLSAATASRGSVDEKRFDPASIAETVGSILIHVRNQANQGLKEILWVDDNPANNTYERQAFESSGLTFTMATTTDQALELLATSKFVAIISDMGRREGPREGYRLLEMTRARGDSTPFFIYAGSNLSKHKKEAESRGAQGSTNDPQELFELVMRAVTKIWD